MESMTAQQETAVDPVVLARRRIAQIEGRQACDLALVHANVVDVFGREVLADRTVLVADGCILGVFPSREMPDPVADEVVDCAGRYLTPGLMDAHLHIESTMLTPPNFARAVLPCGTTEVVADPHEIANVCGREGIAYMLQASEGLPLRIHIALPSCVPCTPFEDAGASLNAEALASFWQEERVCSLGEVMNYPGLLQGDRDLLAKIAAARAAGKKVDGHCPGLGGAALQAYVACGVDNDHEETDLDMLKEHVRAGMYVFVREGSAAKGLAAMLPVVNDKNAHRFCFCTDDLHAEDILHAGHVNAILARAVFLGLDAPTAVAMATLNTAQCFGFKNVGALAPGYCADFVLFEDLVDFRPVLVASRGRIVAREGRLVCDIEDSPVPENILHSVHMAPVVAPSFALPVPSGRARVIGLLPHSLCTRALEMDVVVDEQGNFAADKNPGLCKIAVIERHQHKGLVGLGILQGYAKEGCLLGGALATSISHDSHNIVVAGSNDADMLLAVQKVAEHGGGIAIVQNGSCTGFVPLPVAGLMGLGQARDMAASLSAIQKAALAFAVSPDTDPVMTLSFMALCVIPELRVHTRGLFDVRTFNFTAVDAADGQN